jgi:hypothetical protein
VFAASQEENRVNLAGVQSAQSKLSVHLLVALLCLMLAVQGAHVCRSSRHFELGVQTETGSPTPVCPVCAIAHTLLFTVLFLLLFLMPNNSTAVFQSVEPKKSSWREVRLYMRPPPVL